MHSTIGCGSLDGAELTVVRLRKDGTLGLAKPCGECVRFLKLRGIKRVYYSTGRRKRAYHSDHTYEEFNLIKL